MHPFEVNLSPMLLARLLLILTALIWGTTFVASKICLKYVEPFELMGLRLMLALPVLLVIIGIKRVKFNFGPHKARIAAASAIIAAHFIIQITGIKYTSATNTGWIITLTPLVTAILAYIFLKEKIGLATVIGIILASLGIILLVSKGNFENLSWLSSLGDWLVLISAFTWAAYTIMTRDISRSLNPLAVTFAVLLPSAILAFGAMAIKSNWSSFTRLPMEAIVSLLVLSVLGTSLAHWFWQDGLAKIGAAKAGVFLYLEPIATTAVAVPYLHESFGLFTAAGAALVLLGVWIAQSYSRIQKA
jgi:drug/metabolite transporter (DMT)-like permease